MVTTTFATTTSTRHLTAVALALAGALVVTACGGGDDTAPPGSGMGGMDHGGGTASSAPSAGASASALGNDADRAFLSGMVPHHEQAVRMSDMVLAADPPAPVADLARRVKAAQGPEIEQMQQMLADLGHDADGHTMGEGMGEGMAEHGGMMSAADMERLMGATGTDAARMYLEGMIEHHEGAIDSAEAQIEDGEYEPAVELARQIATDQAAEIVEMERLLADL